MTDRAPGRPRDSEIDDRILEVTRHHLARDGYAALSVVAVAADAATTRQALYRRWPSKAHLATAAIAAMAQLDARPASDDPYADLVAELTAFRRGVSRPDGLSMVGTMLLASANPELVALYRDRVVAPRRARLRNILERAAHHGLLDADSDLEVAVAMLTGSWYANALAGHTPPSRWPERAARLVWRSLGGEPPPAEHP